MVAPSFRARLDQHIIAAKALSYRTMSGGKFEVASDWVRGFSGLEDPIFNIFQPLTGKGLDDDVLADTAAFFSSKGVRYAIELVHDWFPEGPDHLDSRHYESLPPQPAMFLQDFFSHVDVELKPEVSVEQVTSVPSLTAFHSLQNQVFDFDLSDITKRFPVLHLKEGIRNTIRHYLAFCDEQPVGAGTIICLEDVASVWNVCVMDPYREQGVGTTLLYFMLRDAATRHCRMMALYSTPQAYHFFGRFGFEIYTQRQWFLPPGIDYLD